MMDSIKSDEIQSRPGLIQPSEVLKYLQAASDICKPITEKYQLFSETTISRALDGPSIYFFLFLRNTIAGDMCRKQETVLK